MWRSSSCKCKYYDSKRTPCCHPKIRMRSENAYGSNFSSEERLSTAANQFLGVLRTFSSNVAES